MRRIDKNKIDELSTSIVSKAERLGVVGFNFDNRTTKKTTVIKELHNLDACLDMVEDNKKAAKTFRCK